MTSEVQPEIQQSTTPQYTYTCKCAMCYYPYDNNYGLFNCGKNNIGCCNIETQNTCGCCNYSTINTYGCFSGWFDPEYGVCSSSYRTFPKTDYFYSVCCFTIIQTPQ